MRVTRTLRNQCGSNLDCPRVLDTDDPDKVLIQGARVTDPEIITQYRVPDQETLIEVPRTLIPEIGGAPMLSLGELAEYIREHHARDLFRLETRGDYSSGSDAADFRRWLRGHHGPDLDAKRGWLDHLRADLDAGRAWRRVHIVRTPLTEYLRYEMEWCYIPNSDAGEDIRVLDLTATGLDLPDVGDFFVVDGTTAIRMHYADDSTFLGATVVNAVPETYVALRDLLWSAAEPFSAWWARHPQPGRPSQGA